MNNKNIIKKFTLISIFITLLFCIIYFIQPTKTYTKYSKDYSSVDMLSAQKIILGYSKQTEEMIEKYDINLDGEITYTDIQIIQQMIIGIYDTYEVRTHDKKAIKYK